MASRYRAGFGGRDLSVMDLAAVGLERWFDVGSSPPDRSAALDRLKSLLVADETRRPFRFVAVDGEGRVRGKIGGYVTTNGRFTFWAVYHAADATETERCEVARLLVAHCVTTAMDTPGVRFVETKPAFDTLDLESFEPALVSAGLNEVSRSHLYSFELRAGVVAAPPVQGLARLPGHELGWDNLAELFGATQAATLDRAQSEGLLSSVEVIEELRAWAGEVALSSLWITATFHGRAIGYVLGGLTEASGGAKEGFIVELGVLPEFRRRGVGDWLVREVLRSMEPLGVSAVRCLIDDTNYPSRNLHTKIGFLQEPGFFSTWRRTISD